MRRLQSRQPTYVEQKGCYVIWRGAEWEQKVGYLATLPDMEGVGGRRWNTCFGNNRDEGEINSGVVQGSQFIGGKSTRWDLQVLMCLPFCGWENSNKNETRE